MALRTVVILTAIFCLTQGGARSMPRGADEAPAQNTARLRWWRQARFGMFIHWGPVSLRGTEIGWSRGREVPVAEYDSLYHEFNPTKFDARAWVSLAKAAGMKYLVLTARHHDGFCLWDTRLTDYNMMNSPFGRDVVKELAAECRRQGIRFCVYYSILDWRHPDYPIGPAPGGGQKTNPDMRRFMAYVEGQVAELIQGYGPLGLVWFDGEWEDPYTIADAKELCAKVRALQPDIIINNRVGKARDGIAGMDRGDGALGDYATPEQTLGQFNRETPWETCMTICQQWAWKPDDRLKSLQECVRSLVTCAGGDGNFLLNVGPMPTGEIEPRQADRLREIGEWLKGHGVSVYNTTGGPFKPSKRGVSTSRGKTVYVHLFDSPAGDMTLPPLPAKVLRARVLRGAAVGFAQTEQGITLHLSGMTREPMDTVIALELDRPAEALAPVDWPDAD